MSLYCIRAGEVNTLWWRVVIKPQIVLWISVVFWIVLNNFFSLCQSIKSTGVLAGSIMNKVGNLHVKTDQSFKRRVEDKSYERNNCCWSLENHSEESTVLSGSSKVGVVPWPLFNLHNYIQYFPRWDCPSRAVPYLCPYLQILSYILSH